MAQNIYNTAMIQQEYSNWLPTMADRRSHDSAFPHKVYREGGANLWVLEYAVSGLGILCQRTGETRLITPGTFFLFRSHTYQNYGMEPENAAWEHCYATFTPRDYWHEYFSWPQLYKGAWILELAEGQQLQALHDTFVSMIEAFAANTQRREEFFLNDLEKLFLQLDILNPLSISGRIDQRVRSAMDYMRNNFQSEIDIQLLAEHCSLSASRFSHLFQAETGHTPMKYLEMQRLESARALLTMTSMNVQEIAFECGFNNQFYFSRQFKRAYRLSPRAYRQAGGGR